MKKYNFTGFTFGSDGEMVFRIEVLNHTEKGTSVSTQIDLELTVEERTELITQLISIKQFRVGGHLYTDNITKRKGQ